MRCQWPPCQDIHFERANEPLSIARLNADRRLRIDAPEQGMQPIDTPAIRDSLETRAQRFVAAGAGKESPRQRAVIKPRAADENGQPPARRDITDRRRSLARVLGGRVLLRGIGDVDEMVWDALPCGRGYLVGADIESAVDGGGVAADDLAVELPREHHAQRALAGRGGTENRHDERPRHHRPAIARTAASATSAASINSSPICWVRVGWIMTPGFR